MSEGAGGVVESTPGARPGPLPALALTVVTRQGVREVRGCGGTSGTTTPHTPPPPSLSRPPPSPHINSSSSSLFMLPQMYAQAAGGTVWTLSLDILNSGMSSSSFRPLRSFSSTWGRAGE